MIKNILKSFVALLILLSLCASANAETLKVLTQNIWGVPDSVSTLHGGPSIQARRIQFCNKLKNMSQSPNIVLVQEVWDPKDALYLMKNCGYPYYSYQDDETSSTVVNSHFQKLTYNFFEMVKEEINQTLDYFGVNLDDLITGAVCLSYSSTVCNALEEIGIIPDRSKILRTTSWFHDSYVKSGLIILSKYPIVSQYRMVYSDRGDLGSMLSDLERSVTKSLMLVQVKISTGQVLWVANTHLIADQEYESGKSDHYESQRLSQFIEAMAFIKKIVGSDPVIFGGDFNMGDSYPGWEFIKRYLVSYGVQGDLDNSPTYDGDYNKYASGNEGKVDHILGMNGVTAKLEGRAFINDPVSDHYGVYKILDIPIDNIH